MKQLKFDQIRQTWKEISKVDEATLAPDFELALYKKLLNRFHPGPYYYYIFNIVENRLEFVSSELTTVTGYEPELLTVDLIMNNMYPEDVDRFIRYEQEVTRFFNRLPPDKILLYKVSYDYRLRCANGLYKWILQQVSTIQSTDEGGVVRVLGVHTDISLLKTGDIPSGLSFLGLEGEPSYNNILLPQPRLELIPSPLSKRENEVLKLALLGQNSVEIAKFLNVSSQTIKVHRKNILKKTATKNFLELGVKASENRWI